MDMYSGGYSTFCIRQTSQIPEKNEAKSRAYVGRGFGCSAEGGRGGRAHSERGDVFCEVPFIPLEKNSHMGWARNLSESQKTGSGSQPVPLPWT